MVKESTRLARHAELREYRAETNADEMQILKYAMQKWGITRRTAREYLFAL